MRLDEFLDRTDGGVFQVSCEHSVDNLSLFSGPGLRLNTNSPKRKQWNVAHGLLWRLILKFQLQKDDNKALLTQKAPLFVTVLLLLAEVFQVGNNNENSLAKSVPIICGPRKSRPNEKYLIF